MQRYGLAESLDRGDTNRDNRNDGDNKDNSMAVTVVNINECFFYLMRLPYFSLD